MSITDITYDAEHKVRAVQRGPSGELRERDESRWHEGGFVVVDHHALH